METAQTSGPLELAIREIVRTELAAIGPLDAEPELITPDEAAKICGCDKSVILELHKERLGNNFPSVHLGQRTIRIDKRRLNVWFHAGGLGVKS